jgi:hypothetical protein
MGFSQLQKRFSAFVFLLLAGCSTTHHILPARPLERGESLTSFSVVVPVHKFESLSFQVDNYFGLGNEMNFGFNISNFLFFMPTTVSLSRYQDLDRGYLASHLFLNNLFETSYSPLIETGLSLSLMENGYPNSMYLGMGYYAPFSFVRGRFKSDKHEFDSDSRLSIVGQLDLGYGSGGTSVRYNGNLSGYYIDYYNVRKHRMREGYGALPAFEIGNGEIESIDSADLGRDEILRINLKNDSGITIRSRDPYPDCLGCAHRQKTIGAYTVGEDYGVYWVIIPGQYSGLMELSIPEIVSRYRDGKGISIRGIEGAVELKKKRRNPYFEDFSFGINWNSE